MITDELFEEQFNKLCASFSTTKSEKIMDRWHAEFRDCEEKPFKDAMHRCQYGERFPTWDVFRNQYKNCKGEPVTIQEVLGCELCSHGRVFFWDYRRINKDPDNRRLTQVVANCGYCAPDGIPDLSSARTKDFYRDKNGELWSKRAYNEMQRLLKAQKIA